MDRTSSGPTGPSRSRRQVVQAAALIGLMPKLASARDVAAGPPLAELDQWLTRHLPEVAESLNPGATDAQLDRLAALIGAPLPEDYRALYKWHNGQREDPQFLTGPWFGLRFPSLDEVEAIWSGWGDFADDPWSELNELVVALQPGVVKPLYANRGWIPFAQDGHNHLGIDLDPDLQGTRGQVINFGRDEDLKLAIAPGVGAFVRWVVAQLQAGNFRIDDQRGGGRRFNLQHPPARDFFGSIQVLFDPSGSTAVA